MVQNNCDAVIARFRAVYIGTDDALTLERQRQHWCDHLDSRSLSADEREIYLQVSEKCRPTNYMTRFSEPLLRGNGHSFRTWYLRPFAMGAWSEQA